MAVAPAYSMANRPLYGGYTQREHLALNGNGSGSVSSCGCICMLWFLNVIEDEHGMSSYTSAVYGEASLMMGGLRGRKGNLAGTWVNGSSDSVTANCATLGIHLRPSTIQQHVKVGGVCVADRLLGNPYAQSPLRSDWEERPTYPVHSVPCYLAPL